MNGISAPTHPRHPGLVPGSNDALPIAGGRPVVDGGRVVGAIGVSGGSAAEDDEIAQAVLAR